MSESWRHRVLRVGIEPASRREVVLDDLPGYPARLDADGNNGAWLALRRMNVSGNDLVAIFGQGPVGLSATQLAKATGAEVVALDISPSRLSRAREFGADHLIDPSKEDAVARIRDITQGLGADMTLETSGAPSARLAAVQSAKIWGVACYVGEDSTVSPDLLRKQMTIIGSWTFSTVGQAECAKFVADRKIAVDALFTDRWKLEDAEKAYKLFDQQSGGKGVFIS